MGKKPAIDYDEDKTHLNPNDYWYIHGRAYDLTSFIKHHPGGPAALMLTQGRDATALFESYHPFTDRPKILLSKMKQVDLPQEVLSKYCEDTSKGDWFHLPDGRPDPFWEALKKNCGEYVREHKMNFKTSWPWFIFSTSCLLVQPFLYYYGYLNSYPWTSHAASIIMALLFWFGGARIGHDADHWSTSKYYIVNRIWADLGGLGLSNFAYWEVLHAILHHSYTNTENDPDMYHYVFFLRDTPSYRHSIFHRLQAHRVWCYIVWSFTTVGLLLFEPMVLLFTGQLNGTVRIPKFRFLFWAKLIFHLLFFPTVMFFIPVWLNWDTNPNKFIVVGVRFASFAAYLSITGMFFGLFSHINHFSKGCAAAAQKNTGWAQRQVETAANFNVNSFFWNFFTAGINIQIEHHLFPSISADRIHPLVPIVKRTCEEYGVDYKDYQSFGSILASVHEYMDSLALPDASFEKKGKGPIAAMT